MSTLKVNTIQNTSGVEVYTAKAWVNFNGTGTVAIRASGNVSSITDNAAGDYTLNFTTALTDANYAATTSVDNDVATANNSALLVFPTTPFTTTSARFALRTSNGTLGDRNFCSIAIFR